MKIIRLMNAKGRIPQKKVYAEELTIDAYDFLDISSETAGVDTWLGTILFWLRSVAASTISSSITDLSSSFSKGSKASATWLRFSLSAEVAEFAPRSSGVCMTSR